jgi:SAM-dependent methyltransferase
MSNLDVGHGHGDSLLLHFSHPQVPRPSTLTGITSLPSHNLRAQTRISQLTANSPPVHVELWCCDAVQAAHPHPFTDPTHTFTSITAVDCAYHFKTRRKFLQHAFDHLSPGGTIALADMCISPQTSALNHIFRYIMPIPPENLITPLEYHDMFQSLGYDCIVVEDISNDVFPGFARFLSSQGVLWRAFAFIVTLWYRSGGTYVLVSARRPRSMSVG